MLKLLNLKLGLKTRNVHGYWSLVSFHDVNKKKIPRKNHNELQKKSFSLFFIYKSLLQVSEVVSEKLMALPMLSGHDWEDPDDPTVIAENELIGAANSIDAAARKLMALRPRRTETKVPYELWLLLFIY